ncbi:MAG: response regulator [Vicinamibacteria bacterium]|nr:response regulator [Vicinamibacteria bacterium]
MSAEPVSLSLLVVDDDEVFRSRLVLALRARQYEVREAGDAETAMRLAREEPPERALVDLRIPGGSGLDLVRDLKAIDPATEIVVLTGYGSIATAMEAVRLGARDYLTKPTDADRIVVALEGAREGRGSGEDAEETPSLARVEWEHIQRVLADCDGNVSEAARRLGVHRRSLQRKLAKFPALR